MRKYILPYFSSTYFCGEGNDSNTKKKCGAWVSAQGQTYRLSNGVMASFVSKGARGIALETEILYITFDVNGPNKPNRFGTDQFYFVLNPKKGLIPFGQGNITREEILRGKLIPYDGDSIYISCKQTKSPENSNDNYRHGCTLLFVMDEWEFRKDYPY